MNAPVFVRGNGKDHTKKEILFRWCYANRGIGQAVVNGGDREYQSENIEIALL